MQRFISQQLVWWKASVNRKPLILRGARTETYILSAVSNLSNCFKLPLCGEHSMMDDIYSPHVIQKQGP